MAFSDFTYPEVIAEFRLTETTADLFPGLAPVSPSAGLVASLDTGVILATSSDTEKAKSEMLVVPLLMELWARYRGRVTLYSGTELVGDVSAKLVGFCDFILGLGVQLPRLTAPAVAVFEAKKDNVTAGYGQCIAAMVAMQRFNKAAGRTGESVFGVTTTGLNWKFLRLDGGTLTHDLATHSLEPIDRTLGRLVAMIESLLAVPAA